MAAGSKTKIAVTTHVEGVHLDLTMEEAQFLADLLHRVGGNPKQSRRRHQEPISDALRAANVPPNETVRDMRGDINFVNEED